MSVSDELRPYYPPGVPRTCYEVHLLSGMALPSVKSGTGWLHRKGIVRLVKDVPCHPDQAAHSAFAVGLFESEKVAA